VKFFYPASIGHYYTSYMINKFQVPVQIAQNLFVFLLSVAVGTVLGGPIGGPFRSQIRDLGFDPMGDIVYLAAALR
jgi:hypothetical protein